MKRINQYFYGGCIAYTVASIILIIMYRMKHIENFEVKSDANIIIIIILVQTILYFMEDLQIKSQVAHITVELIMIILITFATGIPMKLFRIDSIYGVIEIIIIISLTYGISILSLYLNSKGDAECINRKLKEGKLGKKTDYRGSEY